MIHEKNNKTRLTTNFKNFLKAASLVFALTALTNCSEKIVEEYQPLGSPAIPEAVDKALNDSYAGTSIYYAKPGQFVEYDNNYKAELGNVILLSKTLRTYKGFVETANNYIFQLTENYWEFDRGGVIINEKHSELNLDVKKKLEEAMSFSKDGTKEEDPYCLRAPSNQTKYDCVKFYNLKVYDTLELVPQKAAARANCSNIPNCVIPSRVIQFDRVTFLGETIVEKEIYKFSISKLIPSLLPDQGAPPMNHFCISKLFDGGGVNYYLTQCNVLTDIKL